MKTIEQVATLIKKHIEGTISSAEHKELMEWADKSPSNKALLDELSNHDNVFEDALLYLQLKAHQEDEWMTNFTNKTIAKIKAREKKKTFNKRMSWIAAAATLLIIGTFAYQYSRNGTEDINTTNLDLVQVEPASNKAELVLSNGKKIDLRSDHDIINNKNGLTYSDGTPILTVDKEKLSNVIASIIVPAGGKYQITLPDGTSVWLNSQSKLSYPLAFQDDSRSVTLEGEAYFQVNTILKSGKKVPFLVNTQDQQIQVTGTEFNISAYADNAETVTTLVEGSVNVVAEKYKTSLLPNQQASLSATGIRKQQVDVEQFIAWKKNKFLFFETELKQVMKDISRWYNIEVDFKEHTTPTYLYGEIGRDKNLSDVLRLLQKSGVNFKYTKTGAQQQLIVMP